MVTINCGNYFLNIYKNRLKTTFDKNQYGVLDTNGLWFEVDNSKSKQNCTSEIENKEDFIDDFLSNIIQKFIKLNEKKIEELINLNIEFCIGLKFKNENELNYNKYIFNYEILFLNIELNLYFSEKYIESLFSKENGIIVNDTACLDMGDKKEKYDYLMPELREFFAIQNAKSDILIKRESINSLKLKLMEYRTNIAHSLSSKTITELEINQKSLLKYLYEMAKQIEKLKLIENDLDFEIELLKIINEDHFKSMKNMFKEDELNSEGLDSSKVIANYLIGSSLNFKIDLNSQEFYNRVKIYNFKTKHDTFFRSFFIKKENDYLLKLNQELKNKIRMQEN